MDGVESLECRLGRLEAFVGGRNGPETLPDGAAAQNLVAKLSLVADKLAKVQRDRPDVSKLFEQTDAVKQCCDLSHVDKCCLDTDIKWRMVETNANNIFHSAERLEDVQLAKDVLDSEHIKHTSNHDDKIGNVAKSQASLAMEVDRCVIFGC